MTNGSDLFDFAIFHILLYSCKFWFKGPCNNYVDKMRGAGRESKMSVFVHAQGI